MKSNNRIVQCVETRIIYPSCREADRAYGWPNGTTWRIAAHGEEDSAMSKKYRVHFVYIEDRKYSDEFTDTDEKVKQYLSKSFDKSTSIRCVETSQVFVSCVEADKILGYPRGSTNKILKGQVRSKGYTFEKIGSSISAPQLEADVETFRPIPEFPNYEISNFGRVRHIRIQKIKKPCYNSKNDVWFVVIQKDKRPYTRGIRPLYCSAWGIEYVHNEPKSKRKKAKLIECVTDEKLFFSYSQCSSFYKFDYQRFREALHSTPLDEFEYKGKRFKKIN